jgi:hypothetical protein
MALPREVRGDKPGPGDVAVRGRGVVEQHLGSAFADHQRMLTVGRAVNRGHPLADAVEGCLRDPRVGQPQRRRIDAATSSEGDQSCLGRITQRQLIRMVGVGGS